MTEVPSAIVLPIPKKITLGNFVSMAVTLCVGAFVVGSNWVQFGSRLEHIEDSIRTINSSYIPKVEFDRLQTQVDGIVADRKTASTEVRNRLDQIIATQAGTAAQIASLSASYSALKDNVANLNSNLNMLLSRRTELDPTLYPPSDGLR